MSNETNEFEVSSIANDTYQYFVALHKKTKDLEASIATKITEAETELTNIEQALQNQKQRLKNLKEQKQILNQKTLDIKETIVELEQHKAQFKNIITKK